jgi:hypothetical protein
MPDKAGSGPSPLEQLVAARDAEKKAQRKKDSRVLASIALAVVVLIGGGVFAFVHFAPRSWRHQVSALVKSPASARPSSTASPAVKLTTQPLSPVGANGPPGDPFSGTPADHWADGAAGITIPVAKAHGRYSAAQVRSAFEITRKLLVAGNLDRPTLRGGKPAAFADLLTKEQRATFLAGLRTKALNKDGTQKNTRAWVTSFAPGSTEFVTTVIKVHGTMSARAASESGTPVLRISFDYFFVFAVEPPGDPARWMRIVQQQYDTVDFASWDKPDGPLEPWVYGTGVGTAGVRCSTRDGYIHPDYSLGRSPGQPASGAPQDPYATDTPSAGSAESCRTVTGT